LPINEVVHQIIETEIGSTRDFIGADLFDYIVSIVESAKEDEEDARATLNDLLQGVTEKNTKEVADAILKRYLDSQANITSIQSQNENISTDSNTLQQSIQIEPNRFVELCKPEEPIEVISAKERRKRKKQEARRKLEDEKKKKKFFMAQAPSFPGFRRPTRRGGNKNINLHDPEISIGGTKILGSSDERDPKIIFDDDVLYSLQYPRKYGLVGPNGIGKSTFLRFLSAREIDGIPDTVSFYHVEQEIEKNNNSVLLNVLQADLELFELLNEEQKLYKQDPECEVMLNIYNRLIELDYDTAITRAATILAGLSFTDEMQKKPLSQYSGGWLMRVNLAKALFCSPDILILDEPTNHLDFCAITWLERFLKEWEGTLIVVSHQINFLNSICSDMIVMEYNKLHFYSGDYFQTISLHNEEDPGYYFLRQNLITEMELFIKNFPHSEKRMTKLINETRNAPACSFGSSNQEFRILSGAEINSTRMIDIIGTSFQYPGGKKNVLTNINQSFTFQSRVALVGRNGCGKTTLLNLIANELYPTAGKIERAKHLKISVFTQEFVDQLDMEKTPVEYLSELFPQMKMEAIFNTLANFGLSGLENRFIQLLSGGQKSRLAFAKIACERPHLLLLDEPTNHLDIQASLALSRALSLFEGGVIVVSHDEQLISSVCDQIYHIHNEQLLLWNGSIRQYKEYALTQIDEENRERKKRKKDIKKYYSKSTRSKTSQ